MGRLGNDRGRGRLLEPGRVVYYVIRPWERSLFKQCRRAWDLTARERQDYEPTEPAHVFDFQEAIHDALDVYYFPGMWDWGRVIVRPLAVQAFVKSMRRQRGDYAARCELSPAQQQAWEEHVELGTGMLERYFVWAAEVDRFSPLQVAVLFDVTIPEPGRPDVGLCTADGRGVWYRVRVNMVVSDEHELCWLVEHRITPSTWDDLDALLMDEQSLTRSWAWEVGFFGRLEGTIHNELRMAVPGAGDPPPDVLDVQALPGPSGLIKQQSNEFFRRTQIPRSPAELQRRGPAVAHETMEMIDPGLRVYPNPSLEHCPGCAFREPCVAMNSGGDAQAILDTSYRKRTSEDFEKGRLGSVWGIGPAEISRVREHPGPGN